MIRRTAGALGIALAGVGIALVLRAALRSPQHRSPRHTTPGTVARVARCPRNPPTHRSPAARRVTYYVAADGCDTDAGTSPRLAWRTVRAVDAASLRPGDTVLFQGGATFADATLIPGGDTSVSGAGGAPISFGSYGGGRARLTRGVFFRGEQYLSFSDLILGPTSGIGGSGLEGTGDHISIERMEIGHVTLGIESVGDDWTIAFNDIRDTGDSGMLLGFDADRPGDPPGGRDYLVTGNTITDTGRNPHYTYGTHGIYLKVVNATVTDNTISHFHDDGISIRYRDNTVTGNRISDGAVGLAWFQYDDLPGTSTWHDNTLTGITDAGIFVCGASQGCRRPLETFSLVGNTVHGGSRVAAIVQPPP